VKKQTKAKRYEVRWETPGGVVRREWHPLGKIPLPPCPPWQALWWDDRGRDVLSLISPELLQIYHDAQMPTIERDVSEKDLESECW